MIIERIGNEKIVITLGNTNDTFGIQRLIDYARYLEATALSKAKQSDVNQLADKVSTNWWSKNKKRFINESNC